jgi:hypothetical protein
MTQKESNMRRSLTSIAAAASTMCIGLSAGALAPEEATPAPPTPADSIDVLTPAPNSDAETTWTPERMRAAKPKPMQVLKRDTGTPVEPDPQPE